MKITNRFRDPEMRRVFDTCVTAFTDKSRTLFTPGMDHRRGSSLSIWFWRGYDHVVGNGYWNRGEGRKTYAYAAWRAGRACRAATDP